MISILTQLGIGYPFNNRHDKRTLIGFYQTKANRQRTEVAAQLSRRSWGGTRDKPKNVCVGGYSPASVIRNNF